MQHDITKLCADSLRSFALDNYGVQLKSAHAHELVAAFFGYHSRAALLADIKSPLSSLRQSEFIVLAPTAPIDARRKSLVGLSLDLPDNYILAEGVYSALLAEKWILQKVWPTFEGLALYLADEALKYEPDFFDDQKVQREGVKVEAYPEGVRLTVLREYVSPRRLLSGAPGTIGVTDTFDLRRAAGFIGYVKGNHSSTEAETLDKAKEMMVNANQRQDSERVVLTT